MTREELILWLNISYPIDRVDRDMDKCGNESETRIYERDGKLFALEFFNNHALEKFEDNRYIREVYQPREVLAIKKMVEFTEYIDVE